MKIYLSTAALAILGGATHGWASPWLSQASSAVPSKQNARADKSAAQKPSGAKAHRPPRDVPAIEDDEISKRLAKVLEDSGAPGAVGAIVQLGKRTRVGASGVRCAGKDESMTSADLVHIGSDTKAMTAVLVARLVQAGKMRWDSTVAELLPSIADAIHGDYRGVTVRQLLLHISGLPTNADNWRGFQEADIRTRRLQIAQAAMATKPLATPGEDFIYSNLGVMIAGAMAEAACDATWEALMRKEVFGPLGMATADFGVPGTLGEVDQPWGHTRGLLGSFNPIQLDNDPALGPAGTVHLSMADWAKFVTVFLQDVGPDESNPFLTAESMGVLLASGSESGFGMGWNLVDRGWAGGTALTHAGSNTTWFANAWVAPEVDLAFIVAVNAYGDGVPVAADAFIGECVMAVKDETSR